MTARLPLEPLSRPFPTIAQALAETGGLYAINAFGAFIFAASGPIAVILAVGMRGVLLRREGAPLPPRPGADVPVIRDLHALSAWL